MKNREINGRGSTEMEVCPSGQLLEGTSNCLVHISCTKNEIEKGNGSSLYIRVMLIKAPISTVVFVSQLTIQNGRT